MGLIHLYSATSTSFDNNGTPLVTAREAVVKRDEGFQLTFNIPISQNDLHKQVQKEMIVSAMTPDGVNYFRIWDIEKRTTDVKVTALQLLYSLDVKQINPFGGKQYTGTTVLQAFVNSFKSPISPYTFSSPILTSRNFYTNEEDDTSTSHNALAILNKITDNWSGELMLNGFDVRMISKLGTKTDALLYEHKNIASFSDSSSMNGIVTRIYATATYTPERAEGAEEDPEPVVLTATVDSPLINDYAVVYEATAEYNDARTVDELRTEILKQYSEFNVDKPERTIDVDTNIVDGTAINFGDELVLKYLVHDVDEVIRCVGYEYDPISENYIGVTLGTLEKTFLTKVTEGISSSVTSQLDKLNKQIQVVQTAANGKNRVTYGPNPVPNPIEGDLWFYHPEGRPDEVELLIYQNGLWLPAPFLTDQDKSAFEQEVADYQNAVLAEVALKDKEYKEIFDAYDEKVVTIDQGIADAATKAQSALEEAGISTDLAQTAKDLADTAQSNAQTALSNAQSAISDASNALIASQNAELQVGTALSDASQAIASANTAKTNAQTALTNAQTALTEVGNTKTTVNSLTTRVDEVEGEVELKASQTSVDGISGTVSSHSTTLSQHATAISSKAESSFVNAIKGTVDTHATEISQNATEIASKASASSVNTLTGTVSEHTSLISQNVTAISARLTTAQVNSLVDGKGLAKVTYVDSQITATADSFGLEMTRVEGKIDGLEVGGRNLYPNSANFTEQNKWANTVIDTKDGYTVLRGTGGAHAFSGAIPIESNTTYMYSVEIMFSVDVSQTEHSPIHHQFIDGSNLHAGLYTRVSDGYIPANTWTKVVIKAESRTATSFRPYVIGLPSGSTFWIKNVKLEKGNVATDWTPAPEDTMMENDFNVFKASYEVTAESLTSRLTAVDKAGGRLSTAETKISQNATDISARLTTTQVNSLVDGKGLAKVTYVDSQITATADSFGLAMTRVEGKIDGLEVGGRNLLKNTKDMSGFPWKYTEKYGIFSTVSSKPPSGGYIDTYHPRTPVLEGLVHTVSFYAKAEANMTMVCHFYNPSTTTLSVSSTGDSTNSSDGRAFVNVTTEWKRYWVTWTQSKDGDAKSIIIGRNNTTTRLLIAGVKFEKGNKATDWSPAPEDTMMESDFTVFKNSYESTVNSINTELSKTAKTTDLNGMVTETTLATKQFVTAGTMSTTLTNYAQKNGVPTNTQFNTLKNSYDSMVQTIGTNGSKIAQMVMTDSLFSTKVLDSVDVGGRNYFWDYDGEENSVKNSTSPEDYTYPSSSNNARVVQLEPNTTYTMSAWFRTDVQTSKTLDMFFVHSPVSGIIQHKNGSYPLTTEYIKRTFTFTTGNNPSQRGYARFDLNRSNETQTVTMFMKLAKLEKGNVATDWSPAPEDKANQSQVTQLAGSWALTLKSGNDIKTQINASTDSIRLASKFIHLSGTSLIDNAVIKSAHIDTLNANKIVGNTAEFNTIRAGVLTANAITSTHINANAAMFDKLFSTDSATIRLAARDAWIENANIKGINASKLTAGTINAARISTSSLDNVTIGGRNLLKSTSDFTTVNTLPPTHSIDGNYSTIGTRLRVGRTDKSSKIVFRLSRKIEYGENITISMKIFPWSAVKSTASFIIGYSKSNSGSWMEPPGVAGQLHDIKITITAGYGYTKENYVPNTELWMEVKYPFEIEPGTLMVEAGDLVSNWTPAPEDIVDDLGTRGSVEIHGGNIKADTLDVGAITGNKATFISTGFKSLNSQATINGHAIRIQNSSGEFVEMNNTPELRSDDAGGTAVVLGKGRVHFYDSRGHSKGYVGTDMHTAGSYDFGTFLSKGSGIYKFARMADATQTTYAYYTVKAGLTAPASVITNMVQNGYLPDGNAQQFVAKGNMLSELNGWPAYPNWPALKAGQQIRYKEVTSQTTGDAYEDIWKFGPSTNGDWRIYFAKHATFQGGTTGTSDRRLKHDIETTQVEALGHIESLAFKEFKWNRDNKYEPLGLIAQDSGIVRVADDDMEGIDIQRAIMLGLKGVQELQEIVKEQAEEIRQLKEIINQ